MARAPGVKAGVSCQGGGLGSRQSMYVLCKFCIYVGEGVSFNAPEVNAGVKYCK